MYEVAVHFEGERSADWQSFQKDQQSAGWCRLILNVIFYRLTFNDWPTIKIGLLDT